MIHINNKGKIMAPEWIFYFFVIPWMIVIASVPGIVLTYLFSGLFGQVLNYLYDFKILKTSN